MNDVERSVFLVGRVLAGFFYLIMGMNHFGNLGQMTELVGEVGIPAPGLAVVVTGFLLVIAGVLFIVGYHPLLGVLAATLFFVPVTLVMHNFWAIEDPMARQQELTSFLRNLGLLGSALMFVAIPRPWPMSLDDIIAARSRRETTKPVGEEAAPAEGPNIQTVDPDEELE